MTAFVKKQHQRLLDLRDNLLDAMHQVTRDTLKNAPMGSEASGGEHSGDAGSDTYDRDFALQILSKETDALHEVAAAIERVEKGVYGVCEMSGDKIPNERLEALPFARYTVECQSQWEQENGVSRGRASTASYPNFRL
ncbi:TraR/DksA family transcriptional regulator [Persicirhabdus sediminis]|nr:TraR/DksA C4-type zinc finger protein [Persicirhabdus sediminis]